jgi:trafficking protein particle complex subunit 10
MQSAFDFNHDMDDDDADDDINGFDSNAMGGIVVEEDDSDDDEDGDNNLSSTPMNPTTDDVPKKNKRLTFRSNLTSGFRAMMFPDENTNKHRQQQHQQRLISKKNHGILSYPFLNRITINFVDPTSTTSLAAATGTTQSVASPSSIETVPSDVPIGYYESFCNTFETNYCSTLQNVPIQLFRNGSKGIVNQLQVKTVCSEGGGLILWNNNETNKGGYNRERTRTADSAISDIDASDNSESFSTYGDDDHDVQSSNNSNSVGVEDWHLTPYCYVYFAACENIDHYRTKIKPSIQIFLSQLESTVPKSSSPPPPPTTTTTNSDSSNGTTGSTTAATTTASASSSTPSTTTQTTTTSNAASSGNTGTGTIPSNVNTTSGGAPASNINSASMNKCPPYVIIFVPTGDRSKALEELASPTKPTTATTRRQAVGTAIGSRFAAARRIMSAAGTTTATIGTSGTATTSASTTPSSTTSGSGTRMDGSTHSTGTAVTMSTTDADAGAANNASMVQDDSIVLEHGSIPGTGTSLSSSSSHSSSTTLHRLSRAEREVLRRLTNDFPNGNVCTLSTLTSQSNDGTEDDVSGPFKRIKAKAAAAAASSSLDAIQKAEWSTVMKCISNAIGQSFLQRCQRCDDELRRLDLALRRGNIVSTGSKTVSNDRTLFQWNYFYLVKESLAFTYEQMHLYEEAFLQYDELLAFVPNHQDGSMGTLKLNALADTDETTAATSEVASVVSAMIDDMEHDAVKAAVTSDGKDNTNTIDDDKDDLDDNYNPELDKLQEKQRKKLSVEMLTGNIKKFRQRLQRMSTTVQSDAVEEYILGRQITLLFHMHDPIRIIDRCNSFIQQFHQTKRRLILLEDSAKIKNTNGNMQQRTKQRLLELELWVLSFCWDVKESSKLLLDNTNRHAIFDINLLLRLLCELIEFASRRMKAAGQIMFDDDTTTATAVGDNIELFEQVQNAFSTPWLEQDTGMFDMAFIGTEQQQSIDQELLSDNGPFSFLDIAFSSLHSFREHYSALLQIVIQFHEMCRRFRFSAKFRMQLMDMYILQHKKGLAAEQLRSIVDLYGKERWDYCYFALIFRLASLEREVGTPIQYLTTLVRTFTEHTYKSAPSKPLQILFTDLVAVMEKSKAIKGCRFELAPLFSPIFSLNGLIVPKGMDRTLLKRVYTVGDVILISVTLTSFLPQAIEVDEIFISLVPFRVYVAALEDDYSLKPTDVFKVLRLPGPATVNPGENVFQLDWKPLASGQFIIAEMALRWKEVDFTYRARAMRRRPTIRVDIVPSEPTQRIVVTPKFLIPGHEQPMTISFSAGTDHVRVGSLKLHATPGLLFLDPISTSTDNVSWLTSLVTPLPSCLPGQTVTITVMVKSEIVGKSGDPQEPLLIKLSTRYTYANDDPGDGTSPLIDTSIEAKLPTMNQRIVAIKEYDIIPYGLGKALLNVSVLCNAPIPYTIKSWSVGLPKQLALSETTDMNESLRDMSIEYGEVVMLSFNCKVLLTTKEDDLKATTKLAEPFLCINLENEYGTNFAESMKLDNANRYVLVPRPPTDDTMTEIGALQVSINPSSTEGIVGVPVDFIVKIDKSTISTNLVEIMYRIVSSDSSWIICGQVDGVIKTQSLGDSDLTINFVAIPSLPGIITAFPSIQIFYRQGSTLYPLSIIITKPDILQQKQFKCISLSKHTSIAFPQSLPNRLSTSVSI